MSLEPLDCHSKHLDGEVFPVTVLYSLDLPLSVGQEEHLHIWKPKNNYSKSPKIKFWLDK